MVLLNNFVKKYNLIYLLLYFLLLMLSGCETTKPYYASSPKISPEKDETPDGYYNILHLYMKDGTFYDLRGKNARLMKIDSAYAVVYRDTTLAGKYKIFPANEIGTMKIDIITEDFTIPLIVIGGIIVVLGSLVLLWILSWQGAKM